MQNTQSNRSKYVLAGLVGAVVGGLGVALTTRAVPKMMAGMEAKCKRMMAGMMRKMTKGDDEPGDMCKRMLEGMGQASSPTTGPKLRHSADHRVSAQAPRAPTPSLQD